MGNNYQSNNDNCSILQMGNVATRDLGSNTELSKFDILKLKKMYGCDEKEGTGKQLDIFWKYLL